MLLSKAEELLEQTIPPEIQSILKRLTEAQITLNDLTAEAYYVDVFRTGARFMLAVHDDGYENLNAYRTKRWLAYALR